MIMAVDLRQLEMFQATVDTGNFTRARRQYTEATGPARRGTG